VSLFTFAVLLVKDSVLSLQYCSDFFRSLVLFPGLRMFVCLPLLFYYKEVYVLVFPAFSAAFREVGLLDCNTHCRCKLLGFNS
jgi:hypothetical protein